jgi:hypothetical protein
MIIKYILLIPGVLIIFLNFTYAQVMSAFPEDSPRPWAGIGIAYPDAGISLQISLRTIPVIIRPQIDFGIFQKHGHPINGGKFTLAYVTPFSTLGIGIIGYNIDRVTTRNENQNIRILEEDKIFLWGGILGEMIELFDNLYLTGEIRFLNQEVDKKAIDPENYFETQTLDRFKTTWMIGLKYYFL